MKIVWCSMSVVGFHAWPEAPAEVGYLRERHRHKFNIRVEAEVAENDREVEFHILKRKVRGVLVGSFRFNDIAEAEFGASSCEMIAEKLLHHLRADGLPVVSIAVDEDGECGAKVSVLEVSAAEEVST